MTWPGSKEVGFVDNPSPGPGTIELYESHHRNNTETSQLTENIKHYDTDT